MCPFAIFQSTFTYITLFDPYCPGSYSAIKCQGQPYQIHMTFVWQADSQATLAIRYFEYYLWSRYYWPHLKMRNWGAKKLRILTAMRPWRRPRTKDSYLGFLSSCLFHILWVPQRSEQMCMRTSALLSGW